MNTVRRNYITTKQGQIFTILVLTCILSIGSGLTLLNSATANPTDDSQHWIYHSNSNGSSLRLANSRTLRKKSLKKLPASVKDAVLQAASQRLHLPTSRLTIIQAQQQTWRNGCLELSKPDELCTQVLLVGWRVVVGAADQTLVYHTNDSGSVARLNEKASQIGKNKLPERG